MSYSFDEIMEYHPDNRIIFEEIKRLLPRLIPFVGAGLTQFAYYSWPDALKGIARKLTNNRSKQSVNKLIRERRYLDAAQKLEKIRTPRNLAHDLANLFSADKLEQKRERLFQEPIVLLPYLFPELVLTTNFDESLETVYRESGCPFDSVFLPGHPELLRNYIREGGRGLLKLHGTVTGVHIEYEKIVFTLTQYNQHYGEHSPLTSELRDCLNNRIMLFLGCSLENDRTMEILQEVIRPSDDHYTIIGCKKSKRDEIINSLGQKHIRAILYEEGRHEAVRVILENLLKETDPEQHRFFLTRVQSFEKCTEGEKKSGQSQVLLESLDKRLEIVLRNSGGYHLEKITTQLYPSLKGIRYEASFQIGSTGTNTSLWNCFNKDWKQSVRSHYMLVGAGGCGKTIAMQQTARTLIDNSILAIYIPMHELKPEEGCIEQYIQRYILHRDMTLWENLYQTCYEGTTSGQPSLVLFLDGWNEVRDKRIEQYWFSDILREEIEHMWMSLPGVQVVLAGRERADKNIGWTSLLSYLEVMPLKKSQIETYLKTCNITLPDAEDCIWQTLDNPLMLVLYVNTVGQKEQFGHISGINFISGTKHSSQAAVIWNFLQCQVGKFICLQTRNPYNYFIAINYAAAWVGWNMEQRQQYTLTQQELTGLLNEAGEKYPLWWSQSRYLTNMQQVLPATDWQWETKQIQQILCDETLILCSGGFDEDSDAAGEKAVHFIHQKFRDYYAAIYMRSQLDPYGAQEIPENCHSWQNFAANSEVLDLLHTFLGLKQLDKLWWNQRGIRAHNNSYTMFHLLELYEREGKDISQLDFSKQDLRFVSLQNRNLHTEGICFREAWISNKTLRPQNHEGIISSLAWLPNKKYKSCDFFLSAGLDLRLWNIRTKECHEQWVSHDYGITCIATSRDGSRFATTSHGKKLLIYDTSQLDALPVCFVAQEELFAVSFSPIGSFLAVGDSVGRIFLCSDTGVYLKDVPINEGIPNKKVKMLRFDDSGQYLAALIDEEVLLWWITQDMDLQLLGDKKVQENVLDIAFDNHGATLLYAVEKGAVFRLNTNDLDESNLQWRLEATQWEAAAFSYNSMQLAVYGKDGLKLLNTYNGSCYKEPLVPADYVDQSCSLLAFSVDGRRILCGLENNALLVWRAEQPITRGEFKEEPVCDIKNSDYVLKNFVLLNENILLCAFGSGYLTWWDIELRRCCRCEKLFDVSISRLALSPDKQILVTAGSDCKLNFWNMDKFHKDFRFPTQQLPCFIKDLVFSADGSIFCCSCDDSYVYGWKMEQDLPPLFSIHLEEKIRILSLVFLPDHSLLGGATNGIIYRWKIPETNRLEWPEVDHKGFVSDLAISNDGQSLISISNEDYIFYWKLEDSCWRKYFRLEKAISLSIWHGAAISDDGCYVLAGKVVTDKENELCFFEIRPHGDNGIKLFKKHIPLSSYGVYQVMFFASDAKMAYTTMDGRLFIGDVDSFVIEQPLQLIPNIILVNADFRMAYFEDQDLMELVRMSGGRTDMARVYSPYDNQ